MVLDRGHPLGIQSDDATGARAAVSMDPELVLAEVKMSTGASENNAHVR
jgi:hypothetical protein